MTKLAQFFLVVLLSVSAIHCAWAASPCDGVDRSLTTKRKAALSVAITRQLNVRSADVGESFQFGGWSIIYLSVPAADSPFLFYSRDPLTSSPVTMWSGAAAPFEEREIRDWTLKNAPGIPPKLASCFAWHVTNDRSGLLPN